MCIRDRSCDGKTIKVIEGNMSDAVGYRKLAVNGRYIRGFGVPKYALSLIHISRRVSCVLCL